MADMSRKAFLGLGAMGAAGLVVGCRGDTTPRNRRLRPISWS
jgi:hypothetical protein